MFEEGEDDLEAAKILRGLHYLADAALQIFQTPASAVQMCNRPCQLWSPFALVKVRPSQGVNSVISFKHHPNRDVIVLALSPPPLESATFPLLFLKWSIHLFRSRLLYPNSLLSWTFRSPTGPAIPLFCKVTYFGLACYTAYNHFWTLKITLKEQ